MRVIGSIVITIFVFLCGCSSSAGQKYIAFQYNWDTIPKDFKSDDIVGLTKILGERKSVYESTAEYNKRISEFVEI